MGGAGVPTGWDGVDIAEYSKLYARALRHKSRRPGGMRERFAATGATVTTGVLAAVLLAPGAVADDTEDATRGKVPGRFGTEGSWADFNPSDEGDADAADLERQPAAASRAKYRVPIEVSHCVPVEAAADGARQMVQQRAFYMPLQQGTYSYSSPFGYRVHPVLGGVLLHSGVDMSAPLGTPIHAVGDGVVTQVTSQAAMGDYVVIEHVDSTGATVTSWYLHQYMNQITVQVGQQVTGGQVIGHVGNSGRSTGPHLHLEIRDSSDTPIDPLGWLEASGAMYVGEGCQ